MSDEIARREPPKYADIVLTAEQVEQARERYPELSEEAQIHRMKLSVLASLRHQYKTPDGRSMFGGTQPGAGRRPSKRIGEALVEAAQARHKEVIDAAMSALGPDNDPKVRHKAAMNIAKHEREERQQDLIEDQYSRMTDDDIRRDASKVFAEMIRDGKISLQDLADLAAGSADVVDADVVDADAA